MIYDKQNLWNTVWTPKFCVWSVITDFFESRSNRKVIIYDPRTLVLWVRNVSARSDYEFRITVPNPDLTFLKKKNLFKCLKFCWKWPNFVFDYLHTIFPRKSLNVYKSCSSDIMYGTLKVCFLFSWLGWKGKIRIRIISDPQQWRSYK
jgi:hypothetical protein